MKFATNEGHKPDGIQTELVVYRLNIGLAHVLKRGQWSQADYYEKPEEKAQYDAIIAERKASGVQLMRCYSPVRPGEKFNLGPSRTVTLETKHLFGNQWNTAPDDYSAQGLRVHNWYEEIVPNKTLMIGHYLKITDEMRALCANTFKCGYCAAEYYGEENEGAFCSKCLDSPYLKEKDLPLLRLLPVPIDDRHQERGELTSEEKAEILPVFVQRQTTGADSRNAQRLKKQREDLLHDCELAIGHAKAKRDGMLWLMDHGISIENAIYYSHTGKFGFGWRDDGLGDAVANELQGKLAEFPFQFEIKRRDTK